MPSKIMYKYNISWGCVDGRQGEYFGNTKQELHLQIDLDESLQDIEKDDLKFGFFREFKTEDYEDKDVTWDNSFGITWKKNH
jgi:hypothetical protein